MLFIDNGCKERMPHNNYKVLEKIISSIINTNTLGNTICKSIS